MPTPPDKIMVGAYVDRDLAERFKVWARSTEGGASAALRKFMASAVDGRELPGPIGTAGHRVTVRLKDAERLDLLQAAKARRLLSGSGVVEDGSFNQCRDEGTKKSSASAACVVHEFKEAEIVRQLFLRDAPVWAQP